MIVFLSINLAFLIENVGTVLLMPLVASLCTPLAANGIFTLSEPLIATHGNETAVLHSTLHRMVHALGRATPETIIERSGQVAAAGKHGCLIFR